jgi:hypothetical protein
MTIEDAWEEWIEGKDSNEFHEFNGSLYVVITLPHKFEVFKYHRVLDRQFISPAGEVTRIPPTMTKDEAWELWKLGFESKDHEPD